MPASARIALPSLLLQCLQVYTFHSCALRPTNWAKRSLLRTFIRFTSTIGLRATITPFLADDSCSVGIVCLSLTHRLGGTSDQRDLAVKWADPIAALAILPLIVWEGREAMRGLLLGSSLPESQILPTKCLLKRTRADTWQGDCDQ
jgi:hypothetical protein